MNLVKKIVSIACSGTLLALVFATSVFASAAQSPIRFEAESGKLVGTAKIDTNSHASGGKYVCELNQASGYPNKVIYTIPKCTAGSYRIKMNYVSATNGKIRYQVNNGAILTFSFTLNMGNDWNWDVNSAKDAVDDVNTFTLTGNGTDTLMIQDESGFAWVDWLELVPVTTGTTPGKTTAVTPSSSSKAPVSSKTSSVTSAVSSTSNSDTSTTTAAATVSETITTAAETTVPANSLASTIPGFPWLIVVGIVLVLAGGALIVFLVLRNKKKV